MAQHQLVTGQLEDLSGTILAAYPNVIREMIHGQSGVYALYRRGSLYYVGLASNLMRRMKAHLKDRHSGKWDRFSVYLTVHDEHMKDLESLLLRIVNPPGNRQKGKFRGAKNLMKDLNLLMRERDADHRAALLGGRVAKRRVRKKARSGKGEAALVGAVARAVRLRAWYKGWEYKASLRKDGRISFDGDLYESPSAAAKAICGREGNGWRFWHIKDSRGDWVPLRVLKK
jgi:Restriction Enzyme Adenine Methylase Associated